MMTGKDLIFYILMNNLEDEQIFKDGKLMGFMNEEEAAVKFGVGIATIRTWAELHAIEFIRLGDVLYIPQNASNPMT